MALSEKDKKQLMFIGIGLVAIVGISLIQLNGLKKPKPKPAAAPASSAPAQPSPAPQPAGGAVSSPKPAAGTPSKGPSLRKSLAKKEIEEFLRKQNDLYSMGWGKDPFFPNYSPESANPLPADGAVQKISNKTFVVAEQNPLDSMRLTGIGMAGGKYIATINRQLLRTGEIIDAFKISDINKRIVTLEKDGKKYELHLEK